MSNCSYQCITNTHSCSLWHTLHSSYIVQYLFSSAALLCVWLKAGICIHCLFLCLSLAICANRNSPFDQSIHFAEFVYAGKFHNSRSRLVFSGCLTISFSFSAFKLIGYKTWFWRVGAAVCAAAYWLQANKNEAILWSSLVKACPAR